MQEALIKTYRYVGRIREPEVCLVYGVPLEQLLEDLRHGSSIEASGGL